MASLIGTTGASMVLIRPLLQTNRDREHVRHPVVFFIFLVSNIGGCLLPTGDPPLFLGYLNGVPFEWTLSLLAPWLFSVVVLLAVYFVWDTLAYRRETREHLAADVRHTSPVRLHGAINLLWLLGVILAVAIIVPGRPLPGTDIVVVDFARGRDDRPVRVVDLHHPEWVAEGNRVFERRNFEVAELFFGIFLTMRCPSKSFKPAAEPGLTTPAHFFWATSALSSVLDNAPTYLVFFEAAKSLSPHSRRGNRDAARRRDPPRFARGGVSRRRFHGCQHLHRQRPEPHGQAHCRATSCQNAGIFWLYAL